MGIDPPTRDPHGTLDEISDKMLKLMPHSWKLEGNLLKGQTEMGELVQRIPTDYILIGTDSKGLPKFQKIDI